MKTGIRRCVSGLATAAVLTGVVTTAATAAPGNQPGTAALYVPPTDDPQFLFNVNSSKVLTVASASVDNGAPAEQKYYAYGEVDNTPDLQWTVVPAGDGYEIRNVHSGKCLEIADSRLDDGAPAQQWDCVDIPTQRWDFQAIPESPGGRYVYLVNSNSGKCLEIADSRLDEGAPAQQWSCVGIGTQQWNLAQANIIWT